MAAGKKCIKCEEVGHFVASDLCKSKKKATSGKIQAAQDSDSDTETSSRIVEERTAKVQGAAKSNSIVTKVGIKAGLAINPLTTVAMAEKPLSSGQKWFLR